MASDGHCPPSTESEPELKLLMRLDFSIADNSFLNFLVALFFLYHSENFVRLASHTQHVNFRLITHFTHGAYHWVMPHYKYIYFSINAHSDSQ